MFNFMRKSNKSDELYERDLLLTLREKHSDFRRKLDDEKIEYMEEWMKDRSAREHIYHSTMEERGVEIAEKSADIKALDAKIEAMKENEALRKQILDGKDLEIDRLVKVIASLK